MKTDKDVNILLKLDILNSLRIQNTGNNNIYNEKAF